MQSNLIIEIRHEILIAILCNQTHNLYFLIAFKRINGEAITRPITGQLTNKVSHQKKSTQCNERHLVNSQRNTKQIAFTTVTELLSIKINYSAKRAPFFWHFHNCSRQQQETSRVWKGIKKTFSTTAAVRTFSSFATAHCFILKKTKQQKTRIFIAQ